mgnify:FL=1
MKIEFTRDEVQLMVEKHVLDVLQLPFDSGTQTITIDIGSGYSSACVTVQIKDKSDD